MIGYVPVATVEATDTNIMEEPLPGAGMYSGPVTLTPAGCPLTEKPTFESKLPDTIVIIVEFPLRPCSMEIDAGEAPRVKLGGELTVRAIEAVAASVPAAPVTVTLLVPGTAELLAANVRLLNPVPVIGFGEKDAVTPLGRPVADKVTLP